MNGTWNPVRSIQIQPIIIIIKAMCTRGMGAKIVTELAEVCAAEF